MTGLRRHAHIFVLLAVLMAVVMLIGRTTRRSRATRTRSTSAAMPHAATPHAATPQPVKPAPVAQPATPPAAVAVAPATGVDAGKPAAAAVNIVAQQMRETDAADRALLVAFERAGVKWPVQVAHDLIAAQKRGATAVELEHTIASSLAGNLPAQIAARRWLRDESGAGVATTSTTDTRKVIGNGGGTRRVTDVRKAQ